MGHKIKVGLAGAGWWAVSNHLPILKAREDVEVAAVCRLGRAELSLLQEKFDIPFATEDFSELLAPGRVDAIIISTPHWLHGVQAIAALEAGRHILVEKPLAVAAAEARRIVELQRSSRRVALVPYGWNFRPYFAAARSFVPRLGAIRHIAASMASPTTDLMTGRQVRGTEKELFRPDSSAWSVAGSGGYGWGQLVHLLGALFYLSDLEPRDVYALTGKSTQGADLYDSLSIRMTNGATAAISGSATVPFGSSYQMDIRIFGSEGMLLIDVEEGRERVSLRLDDGTSEDVPLRAGDGAYVCEEPVHRFIDLIAGATADNPGDVLFGCRAVEVVEAMHASAARGAVEAIR